MKTDLGASYDFQNFADDLPVMVWNTDENGSWIYASRRWYDFTGLSAEQTLGSGWLEAVHPDQKEATRITFSEALLNRSALRMNCSLCTRDGKYRYMLAMASPRFNKAGMFCGLAGTCMDITNDKEVEESIRESEKRYRHLFEHSPVALCEEDLSGFRKCAMELKEKGVEDFHAYFKDNPEELIAVLGTIVVEDLNSAILRLVEADSKEQVKNGLDQIFIGETLKSMVSQLQSIAGGGGHFSYETRIKTFKGKVIDVLAHIEFPASGDYKSALVSLVDISEKREAEKMLRESEEQFRILASAVPQLVWAANANGAITYVNDRIYEFAGAVHNKDKTWLLTTIVHPEDYIATQRAWGRAVRNREIFQVEHRTKMNNDEYRWHLSRGIPQKGSNGNITKWFGTTTDIHASMEHAVILENEVRARTAELHTLNDVLQESNKELEHFAHVASHDLREPLRKIRLYLDLINREGEHPDLQKVGRFLSRINSATIRMEMMVKGVLEYSLQNNNEQKNERVNLEKIIKDVKEDLELLIEDKNAHLLYGSLPDIYGSRIKFHQLFYNLINNSLKFARKDVPCIIELSYEFTKDATGKMLCISIQDNGIGFRQEYSEKIFESFSRLNSKDHYEGTGLGLSLCRRIVQRHGGKIISSGSENEGAKFIIYLPVHPGME